MLPRDADSGLTATPLISTDPPVGRASPVISRSVVVLPAPFGPSNPKTDPAGTSRSSRSTARTPPPAVKRLVNPRQTTVTGASDGGGSGRPLTPPAARWSGTGSAPGG